jgi:hypothetical protein
LNGSEQPLIYAPRSHRQMIIQANNVTTDFKTFDVNPSATEFYFNGLRIVFVPIPESNPLCFKKSHFSMGYRFSIDINTVQLDKIVLNREDMFIKKNNMTIAARRTKDLTYCT